MVLRPKVVKRKNYRLRFGSYLLPTIQCLLLTPPFRLFFQSSIVVSVFVSVYLRFNSGESNLNFYFFLSMLCLVDQCSFQIVHFQKNNNTFGKVGEWAYTTHSHCINTTQPPPPPYLSIYLSPFLHNTIQVALHLSLILVLRFIMVSTLFNLIFFLYSFVFKFL